MKESKSGFFLSLLLHGALGGAIIFSFYGGLEWSKKFSFEETPLCTVPIDVITVSEESQAPISKPKTEEPRPKEQQRDKQGAEKAEQNWEELVKEQFSDKNPDTAKTTPLKIQETTITPLDIAKNEITPKELQKQDKEAPKLTQSEKKIIKKPKVKKGSANKSRDREDFLRVLKDVDRHKDEGSMAQTPVTSPEATSRYGAPRVGKLSISIVDRVKRLLESHWRLPPSAHSKGKLVVVVKLKMNPDATVKHVSVLHDEGTTNHPLYNIAAKSALRAVYHPDCNPLPLPLDYYDMWKTFKFRFSPYAF